MQIGIRGGQNTAEGLEYSRDKGMRLITIEVLQNPTLKITEERYKIILKQ